MAAGVPAPVASEGVRGRPPADSSDAAVLQQKPREPPGECQAASLAAVAERQLDQVQCARGPGRTPATWRRDGRLEPRQRPGRGTLRPPDSRFQGPQPLPGNHFQRSCGAPGDMQRQRRPGGAPLPQAARGDSQEAAEVDVQRTPAVPGNEGSLRWDIPQSHGSAGHLSKFGRVENA